MSRKQSKKAQRKRAKREQTKRTKRRERSARAADLPAEPDLLEAPTAEARGVFADLVQAREGAALEAEDTLAMARELPGFTAVLAWLALHEGGEELGAWAEATLSAALEGPPELREMLEDEAWPALARALDEGGAPSEADEARILALLERAGWSSEEEPAPE